ncbi:MAG: FapA family protein, partial [Hungatella hathewayi]|nr:FapA family protein [Hungatella hathewayi]
MSEKSLIFSMFSKFLDNGEEDETKEREVRPYTEDQKPKAETDQRIETVEDWNDAERTRRERLERELAGENGSEEADHAEDAEAEEDVEAGEDVETGTDRDGGGKSSGEEECRDAGIELTVSDDRMAVSVMLIEPSGGGRDITRERIEQELEAHRIIHGIDEEKVSTIAAEHLYRQMFIIARGTPAVDGNDGRIKDYFPREAKIKYASKGNGGIDFKSMNLIHNVGKGELVCELTMPTEPQDGMDVFGQPVRGKNGTMPPIPQGKNVVYSPERDRLLTACEGNLTFRNGRFQVENVFVVSGNVDNSIGNIDFTGSVTIHGDVFEGYTVKAKGDITFMGIVEGAALQAGGSILLHKGMRGMKSGILEAGVDITAKFLEDCTIYAQHNIQAEYIINSEVSCGHDLTLIGKRGAFIAGSCAVHNCMNVKTVGASSHVSTVVTLGMTP